MVAKQNYFQFRPTPRFLVRSLICVTIFFVIAIFLAIEQPLVLKTLIGQGHLLGLPSKATVYTNGKTNTTIGVYKTRGLLVLYTTNPGKQIDVVGIDLKAQWVGTPVGASSSDYSMFLGGLFQSEPGGTFVRYNDGAKRNKPFNPQLKMADNSISFLVSPEESNFGCDSIRIEL